PSAGAVPGRWGACLAVRTPPAAVLCSQGVKRLPDLRSPRQLLFPSSGPGVASPTGAAGAAGQGGAHLTAAYFRIVSVYGPVSPGWYVVTTMLTVSSPRGV